MKWWLTPFPWSILGKPEKKFVIIVSKTQEQAKNHFANIKAELESNRRLMEDFGPFAEKPAEWNKLSLELEYHGAKIMSATLAESLRGVKYLEHRPDLIVCDDLQDGSLNLKESTRAILEHFEQEIVPLGSENTRIVVLGNFIGENSLLTRLEQNIQEGHRRGIFRAYPFLDYNGKVLWQSKFDKLRLKKLENRTSPHAWAREYLLTEESYGKRRFDSEKEEDKHLLKRINERAATIPNPFFKKRNAHMQTPLITQMQKFTILTPAGRRLLDQDPEYKKYIQALAEILKEESRRY